MQALRDLADPTQGIYSTTNLLDARVTYVESLLETYQVCIGAGSPLAHSGLIEMQFSWGVGHAKATLFFFCRRSRGSMGRFQEGYLWMASEGWERPCWPVCVLCGIAF
jgi:hypothetical protein